MVFDSIFANSVVSIGDLCSKALLIAQQAGGGEGRQPPELSPLQSLLASPLVLGAGILMLFYVMVLLPDRRKKQQLSQQLNNLKKNQRVVTIGGIHGVVVSASSDSDVVTLRTDESTGAKIRVNRSAIAQVLEDEKSAAKNSEKD